MKLWVDVEDIFIYALHVKRPSGIQRVAYELQRALAEIAPDSVQFIRHGKQNGSFVTVPFARIEALFDDLSATHPASKEAPVPVPVPVPENKAVPEQNVKEPVAPPRSLYRRLRRRALTALPQPLRDPCTRLWIRMAETAVAAVALLKAIFSIKTWRAQEQALPSVLEPAVKYVPEREKTLAADRGDWLVVLGSPWSCPEYAARVSDYCTLHGLRFALLVYDIIPLRRPEWVDHRLQNAFREWFHSVVPLADAVMAISHATAQDVERYASETSFGLRVPVQTIPLGTGFGQSALPVRTRRLPPRRSFALIVSTIEARKNHLLLLRIWRELTETMPLESIPKLVFAGRVGWLVADLMQQLKNTDWLNGKIVLIDSPSDSELETLYDDCMFTLYPSFYEGWGLPVTESMVHGAPCISSNRTSLPEAGGDLARYFDPDHLAEAVRIVREVIENPEALQAWRERVTRDFKPIPWTDSARAIIEKLQNASGMEMPQRLAATAAAAG
jgi:glycosyltransferase involved in cell wall biosynthesis